MSSQLTKSMSNNHNNIDRILGSGLIALSIIIFIYYTTWVFITPFLDTDHILTSIYPDRYYALLIPLLLLVSAITVVCSVLIYIVINNNIKKRNTNKQKLKST